MEPGRPADDGSRVLGGGIYPDVQEIPPGGAGAEAALASPPGPDTPALRPPDRAAGTPINIAILLPLSEANARVGNALLNAAQMALFDVGGQNLVLWPKDTEGTPEGAARAVEAALQDGVELILGPLFSGSVRAAAESARARGVNVVAFSNDRSVAGNGVFLMGFMPEQQVDRVVNFARTQGITRFAALLPETPFGATVEDALRAAMARGGGDLVRVERYFTDVQDFQDTVQRVADYGRRSGLLRAARRDLEHR
ncbi:MAG: penicillin-binding protein activator, partial [Proteobacteria bacterium]|nr:penicillin-binding protein activator [Pseudomonadota bacterium]